MHKSIRGGVVALVLCLGATAGARGSDKGVEAGTGRHQELMGSGKTKTIVCQKGSEVSITGSSNTYTLTGECKRISVTGSENKVTAETVANLDVTGSDNTVTWQHGAGGAAKPKTSSTGTNNSLAQAK